MPDVPSVDVSEVVFFFVCVRDRKCGLQKKNAFLLFTVEYNIKPRHEQAKIKINMTWL